MLGERALDVVGVGVVAQEPSLDGAPAAIHRPVGLVGRDGERPGGPPVVGAVEREHDGGGLLEPTLRLFELGGGSGGDGGEAVVAVAVMLLEQRAPRDLDAPEELVSPRAPGHQRVLDRRLDGLGARRDEQREKARRGRSRRGALAAAAAAAVATTAATQAEALDQQTVQPCGQLPCLDARRGLRLDGDPPRCEPRELAADGGRVVPERRHTVAAEKVPDLPAVARHEAVAAGLDVLEIETEEAKELAEARAAVLFVERRAGGRRRCRRPRR